MALKRRVNSRWVLIDEGIGRGTYDAFLQISKMIEIFTLMFMNGDVFLWVVVINDRDSLKTTSSYGVRIVPFGKCSTMLWEKPYTPPRGHTSRRHAKKISFYDTLSR